MSIYVIRHADKENGDFYCANVPLNNQPLSETGRKRSIKLVKYFDNIGISNIYVSEYIRTEQTIDAVSKEKQISIIRDKRLNEINVGDTDILNDEQIQKAYPDFWKAYLERNKDFRFPNGESGEEAGSRIFEFFESLNINQNSIIVSHDGIIRTLICKVLSIPTYKRHLFKIELCSITVFEYSNEFLCWTIPKINITL